MAAAWHLLNYVVVYDSTFVLFINRLFELFSVLFGFFKHDSQ